MDLDTPLLFLSLVSAVALTVRSLRSRPVSFDWLVVAGLVFLTLALGGAFFRSAMGTTAFAVWFLLGWAPTLLSHATQLAMERLHYGLAARAAWLIYALHPTAALRRQASRFRVHALEQSGRKADAIQLLRRLSDQERPDTPRAAQLDDTLALLRLEGRYSEIDQLIESPPADLLEANPALLLLFIRLDLETGQRSRALSRYERFGLLLHGTAYAYAHQTARLILLALGGRERAVQAMLHSQFASLAPASKALWSATASLAAGNEGALEALFELTESPDPIVRSAALARIRVQAELCHGELNTRQAALLDRIERSLDIERRFLTGSRTRELPWATWTLALAIVGVFLVEVAAGGSTDYQTLLRLGALESSLVLLKAEWLRLGSFMFLHFGVTHLAFNALGLLAVGPFVERALGRSRFIALYLTSGLVGGLLIVARDAFSQTEMELVVGASGSIMGLIGAATAILLRGYRREKALVTKRRLYLFLAVIGLQTLVDFLIPQISFFAHFVGVLTGFSAAMMVSHPGTEPESVALPSR